MNAVALRVSSATLFLLPAVLPLAQAPVRAQTVASPQPSAAPPPATASSLLQPSIDILRTAVMGVHAEKWKAPAVLRQETDTNLDSIRRDLDETLPGLLATADAAPASIARVLPVEQNFGALYDTVLRVNAVARLSAPAAQASALDQAVASLKDARRAFGDSLQAGAAAQEKQIVDLKAALAAVPPPAPPTPVAAPAMAPAPVKKVKPKPKPVTPPPSQ